MDYIVIVMFTWGVYRVVTKTPRLLIQEVSEQEGFITAKTY